MKKHRLAVAAALLLVALCSFLPAPPLAEGGAEEEVTAPQLLKIVDPQYPEDAKAEGAQGKIVLEVQVLEDGTVGKVSVKEDVPDHPSFAESALEAVSQWEFKPATRGGKPVAITVAVPIVFRLE